MAIKSQGPQANSTRPATQTPIESREDFTTSSGRKDPVGYWSAEIRASQKMLEHWHKEADRISRRFIDERRAQHRETDARISRLNLFYSNTTTIRDTLYGRIPKVHVQRAFQDPEDDVGRTAALIMERALNNDARLNADEYDSVLKAVLQDRLVPGLGIAKLRYAFEPLPPNVTPLPTALPQPQLDRESAPADYFHWRDVLWSWARTWAEVRWMAYRGYMRKDEIEARFPDVKADQLTYRQRALNGDIPDTSDNPDDSDYWLTAEVWEVWDKQTRSVLWIHLDYPTPLDQRPDPLDLLHFFPSPAPLIANPTTNLLRPTPDFHMAQDLYNQIDVLQTRIAIITEAVRVVGVYDANIDSVKRMLQEGVENELIPVDSWAMFAEKGGLNGVIDWFPVADVVAALVQLRELRDENIELLYQATGMNDVMRGALTNQYEGVGQTDAKVQFGSVRLQALQQSFARFATQMVSLKAEIMMRHFEASSLRELSNIQATQTARANPQLVEQALQLLASPEQAMLHITVRGEDLAMLDYQREQTERSEFLTATGAYMQSMAPLVEQVPQSGPYFIQLLKWVLSGFRNANDIETVVDQLAAAFQQQAQNPPDDGEAVKQQAALQLEQLKGQNAIELRNADFQADVQTAQAEHQMKLAEKQADMAADLATIEAKLIADMRTAQADATANAQQAQSTQAGEMAKSVLDHELELDKIREQAEAKIAETVTTSDAKVREIREQARLSPQEPQSDS